MSVQAETSKFFTVILAVALIFITGTAIAGESTGAFMHGKIIGRVIDAETGDVLPSVNITVIDTKMGASTNFKGQFYILGVPVGKYSIRATSIGFAPVRITDVWVSSGLETKLNIVMSQKSLEFDKEVVVTATKYDVGKLASGTIHIISEEEITRYPAENLFDIMGVFPGIVDNAFVRGGRSSEIDYQLDGVSFRDFMFGGLPQGALISNLALKEIQIITGGFSANYGNALSGVVNLITRDAGPIWTGEIRVKRSFAQMNGRNESAKLNSRGEKIIEFTASGPIKFSDKRLSTFLTGKLNTQQNRTPGLAVKDPLNNNITAYTHNTFNELYLFGKTSFEASENFKLSAGGFIAGTNHEENSWFWQYNQSLNSLPSVSQKTNLAYAKFSHNPFRNFLYEGTIKYMNHRYTKGLKDETHAFSWWSSYPIAPQVNYETPVLYGANNPYGVLDVFINEGALDSYWSTKSEYFSADLSGMWQIKEYLLLKSGLEAKKYNIRNIYRGNFFEEPSYQQDNYEYNPIEYSGFSTGTLYLSKLNIEAGIRFNLIDLYAPMSPKYLSEGDDQEFNVSPKMRLSPQIGISYEANNSMVGHFNYGTYHQAPSYHSLFAENSEIFFDSPTNMLEGNPHLTMQQVHSFEAGITFNLPKKLLFNITIYTKKFDNLEDINALPFDGISETSEITDNGSGNVNGLELNLTKLKNNNMSMRMSYTFSSAKGTLSFIEPPKFNAYSFAGATSQRSTYLSEVFSINSPYEYYLPFDKKHNIRAVFDYSIPDNGGPSLLGSYPLGNMNLFMTTVFETGAPYSRLDFDGNIIGKYNEIRHPWFTNTNLRIQKFFLKNNRGLCLFMDFRNLFNRTAPRYYYPITGSADYPGLLQNAYRQNIPQDNPTLTTTLLYNPISDTNNDGIIDHSENVAAYQNFLKDFVKLKPLYQKPREVWIGIKFQF